jgi:cell division protein FtsZ
LLEEVNLTGARGVLVNVTAGLDLSIGEFEEVGNTVRACASDEANVVVGTVIDPDMTDELRVTVVATGLAEAYGQAPAPREVKQAAQPVARRPNGEVDYHHLERPAVIRRRNLGNTALAQEHDADYLDVPAFLRQQAD